MSNVAIVKTGSQYAVASYNPHHSNWIAGNAYARTPEGAVNYSCSDSLEKYPSKASAMRYLLQQHIAGDTAANAIIEITGCDYTVHEMEEGGLSPWSFKSPNLDIEDLTISQLRAVYAKVFCDD